MTEMKDEDGRYQAPEDPKDVSVQEDVARHMAREVAFAINHRMVFDLVIAAFLKAAEEKGWRLVPDNATPEMYDAGEANGQPNRRDGHMGHVYRAMVAAAPRWLK